MQDVFYIQDVDQALALLKPARIDLLKRLDEARTCPELADMLGDSAQKIYYHVKALEKAGLVEKVDEKRVRGVVEGYYRAKARSYWLAPQLVGQIGGERITRDQISLRTLLGLAAEIHDDIGHLAHSAEAGHDVPSLSLSAHIHLPDSRRRAEFLQEVQTIFQHLARKYGIPEDDVHIADEQGFRLVLVCYPKTTE
ncbi:MAG: helix-turn-helix domain-containing protein [Anaerolineae bacterium]|nr:helix-turn-helix domain-containing protein [Anaerolineae bacterium]